MQTFASRMIASLRKKDKGRYSCKKDVAGFEAIPIDYRTCTISLCAKLANNSSYVTNDPFFLPQILFWMLDMAESIAGRWLANTKKKI